MKILVPVKQVLDPMLNSQLQTAEINGQGGVNITNPFCAIALEEAVRLKEQGLISDVVVVSVGDKNTIKFLRKILASGADRALLVEVDSDEFLCPNDIAKMLRHVVRLESPDLILMGKQSIDYENNQVAQILSALLGWPQITAASNIILKQNIITVEHEIDDGSRTDSFLLPGIISVDLPLNEPRAVGLAEVMKARTKPLDILQAKDFMSDSFSHLELLDVISPHREVSLNMLDNVKDLAAVIKRYALHP
jgi:electron transfer flavoprotein beta subunit